MRRYSLSNFVKKGFRILGDDVEVVDLEINQNGWKHSSLLINNKSNVVYADIQAYAEAAGYVESDPQVQQLLINLNNQVPIAVARDPYDDTVTIRIGNEDFSSTEVNWAEVANIRSEFMLDEVQKGRNDLILLQNTKIQGSYDTEKALKIAICSWNPDDYLGSPSNVDSYVSEMGVSFQFDDPRKAAKTLLSRIGLDAGLYPLVGFTYLATEITSGNPFTHVGMMTDWMPFQGTTVVLPPDSSGRTGICTGPWLGHELIFLCPMIYGNGDNSDIVYPCTVKDGVVSTWPNAGYHKPHGLDTSMGRLHRSDRLRETPVTLGRVDATIGGPDYFAGGYSLLSNMGIDNVVNSAKGRVILFRDPPATTDNWSGFTGFDIGYDDDQYMAIRVTNPYLRSSSTWKVAMGTGLTDILARRCTTTALESGTSGVQRLPIQPAAINTRLSVEALVQYMLDQRDGLPAAKQQALDDGVADLNPYRDGLVSATVLSFGLNYPTKASCESTRLYRELQDQNPDKLDEDLRPEDRKDKGEPITFLSAISKLDKLNGKGKKVYCVTHLVDEALDIAAMASRSVLNIIDSGLYPTIYLDVDDVTGQISGRYMSGSVPSTLQPFETMLLVAHGAPVSGDLAAFEIQEQLAEGWQEDLASQDISQLVKGGHLDANSVISWQSIEQNSFLDSNGYPYVSYVDEDSRTRALLAYKGFSEDLGDIVLPAFFAAGLGA